MVADNGKFRISRWMAAYLKYGDFGLREKKFLLATIYFQHLLGDWPTSDWQEEAAQTHWIPIADYRALGCAPRANDTRFFQAATGFWLGQGHLFEHLKLCTDQSMISWQFSEDAFHLMSLMDEYALLTAQTMRQLRTSMDLDIWVQTALRHRMQRPEFTMFDTWRDPFANEPCKGPTYFKLKNNRRRLEASLQRFADLLGYSFRVGYRQGGAEPGFTEAIIRIRHARTRWPEGRLKQFPPRTQVIDV